MSSALSRAERAEIGRSALGDGGMDGGSMTGEGGFSTAAIITASIPGTAAISGSDGDGDGVEVTGRGTEIA